MLLDDRQIAQLHGFVGPTFFAYAVFFAAITSRWWQAASFANREIPGQFASTAWFVVALALFQIVCGSQLRHVSGMTSHALFGLAVQLHLVVGVILMLVAAALSLAILRHNQARHRLKTPGVALAALVGLQILLGVATWLSKYGIPAAFMSLLPSTMTLQAEGMLASILATAHVANGALVLGTSTLIAIRSSRYAGSGQEAQTGAAFTGVAA